MERLKEWASSNVTTVTEGTPISECGSIMYENCIRHLPVVDAEGRVTGLLTDFEIFLRGWMAGRMWVPHDDADQWLLAKELARVPDVICFVDDTLLHVLERLGDTMQDAALIVDDGRPVGILTEHDVVRMAARYLTIDDGGPDHSPSPTSVSRHEPAVAARGLMSARRMRHLMVVDGEKLHGVLSFRDVAVESQLEGVRCEDVMRFGPIRHVVGSTTFWEAASIMAKHKVGCVPVVDEEWRPAQMITRSDLLRAMIDVLRAMA